MLKEELASSFKIRPYEKRSGLVIGKLGAGNKKCLDYLPYPNVLAIGNMGSWKMGAVVKPVCERALRDGHSVVVVSGKAEAYNDLHTMFEQAGYTVKHVNFYDLQESDSWNCLNWVRSKKTKVEKGFAASEIALNLLDSADEPKALKNSAVSLLKALILRLDAGDSGGGGKETLADIYDMLCQSDAAEYIDSLFSKAFSPEIPDRVVNAYESWKKELNMIGEEKRQSVFDAITRALMVLKDENAKRVLTGEDVDFSVIGKEKCAYFVSCPVPATKCTPFAPLFTEIAFRSMIDENSDEIHGEIILLNTGAYDCRIRNLDLMVEIAKERNCAFCITESPYGIDSSYKNDISGIAANCDIVDVLGERVGEDDVPFLRTKADDKTLSDLKLYDLGVKEVAVFIRQEKPFIVNKANC